MRSRYPLTLTAAAAGLILVAFVLAQVATAAGPVSDGGGSGSPNPEVAAAGDGAAVPAPASPAAAALAGAIADASDAQSTTGTELANPAANPSAANPSAAAPAGQQTQTTVTPALSLPGSSGPVPGSKLPSVAQSTPLMSSGRCPIFPPSNVWNKDISSLPVASNSTAMVNAIGRDRYLHPDFDAVGDGIPYNLVTATTPKYTVRFDYAGESDPGPYPIPANPKIEGGSDAHMLVLDKGACRLYELYDVRKSGSTWYAGSGAIWNLRSNALRPAGWTSADAAGLPILPGLVLYSEVQSGVIKHAIRFTASDTCGYIYPARHLTADPCSNLPPMGLRVRLKASVDISRFGPQARVVLTALKHYGMILADNGSPWFISGEPDTRWNDDSLHLLQSLTGTDFEVVNTSSLRNG